MGYHGRMKAEMSFKDKLTDYRNRYGRLKGKGSKGRFLTRLSEAFGFERKYLTSCSTGKGSSGLHEGGDAHTARLLSGWR